MWFFSAKLLMTFSTSESKLAVIFSLDTFFKQGRVERSTSILPNSLSGNLSTFFKACFRFGFFIFAMERLPTFPEIFIILMDVFNNAFNCSYRELSRSNHFKSHERNLNFGFLPFCYYMHMSWAM